MLVLLTSSPGSKHWDTMLIGRFSMRRILVFLSVDVALFLREADSPTLG